MAYTDRVLYTPERLAKIATEAAKEDSIFSLNDRIGLVHDAMALAQAGLAKVSSALNLVDVLRNEKECGCIRSWNLLEDLTREISRLGLGWHQ